MGFFEPTLPLYRFPNQNFDARNSWFQVVAWKWCWCWCWCCAKNEPRTTNQFEGNWRDYCRAGLQRFWVVLHILITRNSIHSFNAPTFQDSQFPTLSFHSVKVFLEHWRCICCGGLLCFEFLIVHYTSWRTYGIFVFSSVFMNSPALRFWECPFSCFETQRRSQHFRRDASSHRCPAAGVDGSSRTPFRYRENTSLVSNVLSQDAFKCPQRKLKLIRDKEGVGGEEGFLGQFLCKFLFINIQICFGNL